jgi:hypothetical protein
MTDPIVHGSANGPTLISPAGRKEAQCFSIRKKRSRHEQINSSDDKSSWIWPIQTGA